MRYSVLAAATLLAVMFLVSCCKRQPVTHYDNNLTFEIVLTDEKGVGETKAKDIGGTLIYETFSIPVSIKLAGPPPVLDEQAKVTCRVGAGFAFDVSPLIKGETVRLPIFVAGEYEVRLEGRFNDGVIAQTIIVRLINRP